MGKILCISSFVARGHVGLQATIPALQGLGHETIALPTVMLSNHPGHSEFSKHEIPAAALTAMIDAYERSGWLADIDAVLTGYLPASAHVAAAADAISRVRRQNPEALIVCDPVMGDDPDGLYIPLEAAVAIREVLVPNANVITPNRFELERLSKRPVSTQDEALAAARGLGAPAVLVTSLPLSDQALGNLLVETANDTLAAVPLLADVPHGTGDFLAALYLGHILNRHAPQHALHLAAAGVMAVASRSQGSQELVVVPDQDVWIAPI